MRRLSWILPKASFARKGFYEPRASRRARRDRVLKISQNQAPRMRHPSKIQLGPPLKFHSGPLRAGRASRNRFYLIFSFFEGRLTRELRFFRFLQTLQLILHVLPRGLSPPQKVRFSLLSFENNHIVSFKTFALAAFGLGFREKSMDVQWKTRGCAQNPAFYDAICISATARRHSLGF